MRKNRVGDEHFSRKNCTNNVLILLLSVLNLLIGEEQRREGEKEWRTKGNDNKNCIAV